MQVLGTCRVDARRIKVQDRWSRILLVEFLRLLVVILGGAYVEIHWRTGEEEFIFLFLVFLLLKEMKMPRESKVYLFCSCY